jgi:hypothetical protein
MYVNTNGDTPSRFLTSTSARCIPCRLGEYCAEGTYEGKLDTSREQARSRECPAGFYCPSASEKYECMAGTYCINGSIEPYTCDFSKLVFQDAFAEIPMPSFTALERVFVSGDPLGGNFCAERSVTPVTKCVFCAERMHHASMLYAFAGFPGGSYSMPPPPIVVDVFIVRIKIFQGLTVIFRAVVSQAIFVLQSVSSTLVLSGTFVPHRVSRLFLVPG